MNAAASRRDVFPPLLAAALDFCDASSIHVKVPQSVFDGLKEHLSAKEMVEDAYTRSTPVETTAIPVTGTMNSPIPTTELSTLSLAQLLKVKEYGVQNWSTTTSTPLCTLLDFFRR
ncbi:hypothetical protein C8R44DRAFT_894364 [Mycena epipterygia]|nr:hypothetical protein C8R44DRAFT_894364 [Mycena epipterygia]